MPGRSLPETAVETVRRYWDDKVPAQHRDQVRVECDVRGTKITISERRPPWEADPGAEWTRQSVAQLRYETGGGAWQLYFADRNGRWHVYDMAERTARVDELLQEIDRDPTGSSGAD